MPANFKFVGFFVDNKIFVYKQINKKNASYNKMDD